MRRMLGLIVLLSALYAAPAAAQSYRGPTRVNFDERVIKGQTAKAGSVYIFDRQETTISSLVSKKRSFRYRTIRTIFED